jgi:hypothetical protein
MRVPSKCRIASAEVVPILDRREDRERDWIWDELRQSHLGQVRQIEDGYFSLSPDRCQSILDGCALMSILGRRRKTRSGHERSSVHVASSDPTGRIHLEVGEWGYPSACSLKAAAPTDGVTTGIRFPPSRALWQRRRPKCASIVERRSIVARCQSRQWAVHLIDLFSVLSPESEHSGNPKTGPSVSFPRCP